MKSDRILFAFVLVGVILIVLSSFTGSVRFLTVLSGSMSPTLNQGDMVVSASVPLTAIKPGDVISFRSTDGKTLVTHRVVEAKSDGFIVKGDANEDPDPTAVGLTQVVGRMAFSLPLFGYLLFFSKSFYGFLVFIVVPGVLIIINEGKKIRGIMKSGSAPKPLLLFGVLAAIMLMNFGPTHAYFNDLEQSAGNVIALAPDACLFTNVTKYWTDTCFNRMDAAYNSTFYLVYHNDTGKVTATNPGGFYIYINISDTPNITSLQVTDNILGNILSSGDFKTKGGNSFQVALSSGEGITKSFNWSFDGTTLSASLKPGKTIKADDWIWMVLHVEYAIDSLTWDEAANLFPHLYTNQLTVAINGQTYHSEASLTARVKMVGTDFGKYGYSFLTLVGAPEPPQPTPPAIESLTIALNETNSTTELNETDNSTIEANTTIEEPILNETLDNSTIETNQSDTGLNETLQENTTMDMNTTEPGLNETIPGNTTMETNVTEPGGNSTNETIEEPVLNETAVYHMEVGWNTFTVPSDWAPTTAMQLTIDYPQLYVIAYEYIDGDLAGNWSGYVREDPESENFDVLPNSLLWIWPSEPVDIVIG